jgi:hypothetical protein
MKLTEYANTAINAMYLASQVGVSAVWDLSAVDSTFPKHDNPNLEYNRHAIQFIGSSCLTKIVDAYQWYNGRIFNELARHDSSAFEQFGESVNLTAPELRRIAAGENPIAVAAEKISFRDSTVRRHLHKVLGLWEESEMSILVTIRNCLGHHLGMDVRGEVAEWISEGKSPWHLKDHVTIENGEIILGRDIPMNLSEIGLAQISIFDQMVANTFGLATEQPSTINLKRSRRG